MSRILEQAVREFDAAKARLEAVQTPDDDAVLDFLATLPPLEYDRVRKTEAAKLRVSLATLDRAVSTRRRRLAAAVGSADKLQLRDFEPAEGPVDGEQLLSRLVWMLERYVIFPPHGAVAVALWILRAHAHDLFDVNPRLALVSPEKRCGKTTLLELLHCLTPRALLVSNVTSAALFRIIESARPTLLMDEVDSFQDADEELRGILNSGHRRAAAFVLRCVGDEHEPRPFSTWAPIVYAMIGEPPDTLRDRSIFIRMHRRAPNEKVERLRWTGKAGAGLQASLVALAEGITRWVQDHTEDLRQHEPMIPDGLHDRAADNWTALLSIAEIVGGEWPERARDAAVALSGDRNVESESVRVQLLSDIRTVFVECKKDRLASKELCANLVLMEEKPWATWKHGHGITPNQLARMLRPFGISSRDIWAKMNGYGVKQGCVKGYLIDDFKEAFDRYLARDLSFSVGKGILTRESARTRTQSGDDSLFQDARDAASRLSQNGPNVAPDAASRVLADRNGGFDAQIPNGEIIRARLAQIQPLWRRARPMFETNGVKGGERRWKTMS